MSKTDACVVDWNPVEYRRDSRLVTFLSDTHVSAAMSHELSVNQLCCLQGTPKLLHPKPQNKVRSAWLAPGSVRNTRSLKFLKTQKMQSRPQDRNNSTTSDIDFKYSPCVAKLAGKPVTINNLKICRLSQFDSTIEGSIENASIYDDKILSEQSKPNYDLKNSNANAANKISDAFNSNPGVANSNSGVANSNPGVANSNPGVANSNSHVVRSSDVASINLDVADINLDKINSSFDADNINSDAFNINSDVYNINSDVANGNSVRKAKDNSETKQDMTIVELFPGVTSYILDVGPKVQNNGIASKEKESKGKLKEQLLCSLKECPTEPNNPNDDISLTWYKKVVERELELYLQKVHRKISEGREQEGETTRQSFRSRQISPNPLPSRTVGNSQTQEMTQIHRINRTARYVRYLLWKQSIGKSKDRLDFRRSKYYENLKFD